MKKIAILLVLIAVGASSAFAQLALTVQGAYYGDKYTDSVESIADRFENGEGLFYGLGVEFLANNLAVGAAGNFSFYNEDIWNIGYAVPMVDYDLMAYAGFHAFGATAFLDPFVEAGIGYMAQDYGVEEYNGYTLDSDPDNPLIASAYLYLGAGLGVNLGSLGAFVKASYNYPIGTPIKAETSYTDGTGTHTATYDLAAYPVSNLKVTLGLKLIF